MATYVLDTSALLAHCFGEPGAEQVNALWQDRASQIAICVVTLPELITQLKMHIRNPVDTRRLYEMYADQLTQTTP